MARLPGLADQTPQPTVAFATPLQRWSMRPAPVAVAIHHAAAREGLHDRA